MDYKDFLKLDIEGSEYSLLEDISSLAHLFSGIALEVHDLDERSHDFCNLMNMFNVNGRKMNGIRR